MLKSNKLLDAVARREENGYCRRTAYEDIATKSNVKKEHLNRVAINEQNDNTVEVRIFHWATKAEILRSYVQFVDSMIEYTRDKKRTATVTAWKKYIAGLEKYKDVYAIVKDMDFPLASSTVSRTEPKFKDVNVNVLGLKHILAGAFFEFRGVKTKVLEVGITTDGSLPFFLGLDGYGKHKVADNTLISVRIN